MSRQRTSPVWKMSSVDFRKLVEESKTCKNALEVLGLKNKGNNFRTFKKRILEEGIDCSHFLKSHDVMVMVNRRRKMNLDDIMVAGSSYSRSNLKKRLLDGGLIRNECYECGQTDEWKGKKLVMVLDHVNGISDDNRIENLRMLCPNCNSQQETFCGKHNKRKRFGFCPSCGQKKHLDAKMCSRCAHIKRGLKSRKCVRPPISEVVDFVSENGWEAAGRRYGVSSTAIRGWIKNG